MSTAARKARKRAGIRFEKPAKVGTPVMQRSVPLVMDGSGMLWPSKRARRKQRDRVELLKKYEKKGRLARLVTRKAA